MAAVTYAEDCPKCGSAKGWHGPQFYGAVGYLATEQILESPTVVTLDDGRELIDREAARRLSMSVHQRLEFTCKICTYRVTLKTLDSL